MTRFFLQPIEHPMQELVLRAFDKQPTHDVISLLPYFGAGADFRDGSGVGAYREVIEDTLKYLVRVGVLEYEPRTRKYVLEMRMAVR